MRSRLHTCSGRPTFLYDLWGKEGAVYFDTSVKCSGRTLVPPTTNGHGRGFVPSEGHSLKVLMNLTSSSPVGHQRPLLEGTSCSWTGGTQLYPQLSELPSWIISYSHYGCLGQRLLNSFEHSHPTTGNRIHYLQ